MGNCSDSCVFMFGVELMCNLLFRCWVCLIWFFRLWLCWMVCRLKLVLLFLMWILI